MGNGMDKILPGLFVGNFRDSKDQLQLQENHITHILAIHDSARRLHADKVYLCIPASDCASQDLSQFFPETNDFIHSARLSGGNVLVHCLAGVSRSVTVTVAYVMTVTGLGWRDALKAVRGARRCANPNFGFQRQLLTFQHEQVTQERKRLLSQFPSCSKHSPDLEECQRLIEVHQQWVLYGDDPEENTYPLSLNAYSDKEKEKDGKTEKNSSSAPDNGSIKENMSTVSEDIRSGMYESRSVIDVDGRGSFVDCNSATVQITTAPQYELAVQEIHNGTSTKQQSGGQSEAGTDCTDNLKHTDVDAKVTAMFETKE